MIVTLATRASISFSATTLPESCQEQALQHLMTLRVASWSMYPSLCKGDCLELGPPNPLHTSDLIVFRKPFGLVCHRLVAQHDDLAFVKGDASSGLPEQIMISDVIGIVTAVVRGSTRVAVADLGKLTPPAPWTRILDDVIITLQENSRWIVRRAIQPVLRHPLLGELIARQIARFAAIEEFEPSPIQAFHDAVVPDGPNLSSGQRGARNPLPLLGIRLGPISLGIFHSNSNRLDIRPILAGTPIETILARIASERLAATSSCMSS